MTFLCQYKHIVDWCGCSPNDFTMQDVAKVFKPKRLSFFARKFEESLFQKPLNLVHSKIYPDEVDVRHSSWDSYWESVWEEQFDKLSNPKMTFIYSKIAEANGVKFSDVKSINMYKKHDTFYGYVFTKTNSEETYITVKMPNFVVHRQDWLTTTLDSILIGSNWDVKELIFRDWGGIIDLNDRVYISLYYRNVVRVFDYVAAVAFIFL